MTNTTKTKTERRIVVARLLVRASIAAGARDLGTCVLGAGIALDVASPKRPRKKERGARRILIPAPFQGNIGSQDACAAALAFLRDEGLAVYWYDGAID